MKTKLCPLLLALALPAAVQGQIVYQNNGDGTATIIYPSCVIGAEVIPASALVGGVALPVTGIGAGAFTGCTTLTQVTIHNNITSIGNYAFTDCISLSAINVSPPNSLYFSSVSGVLFNKSQTTLIQYPIGNTATSYAVLPGVTSIGNGAFEYCGNLTSVTIPTNVVSIGDFAFAYCSGLTAIYFQGNAPSSVDASVFAGDSSLTVYAVSVTTGWDAFTAATGITPVLTGLIPYMYVTNNGAITITAYTGSGGTVAIPGTINNLPVTSLGASAFSKYTSLTNVTIPNSITNIGSEAFYDCVHLAGVTIGTGVTSIGDSAFYDCTSLTNVTIPASVTSIGDEAFYGIPNLAKVYAAGSAPASMGTNVFGDPPTIYYLPGATGAGWAAYAVASGVPVAVWQPQTLTSDGGFGVQNNQFGFNIQWASGMTVVVEACTDLANPVWSPLQTNTLAGSTLYFSDPQSSNYPVRFYRITTP